MKFRPDHKAIALLKHQPMMHAYINAAARITAEGVAAYAPKRTGHYAQSIAVRSLNYSDARARITANDFKAYWIEFGAGPSPVRGGHPFKARHPLKYACLAEGMRFNDRYGL